MDNLLRKPQIPMPGLAGTRIPSNSICLMEQFSINSSYPSGRYESSHRFPNGDLTDSRSFHTEIINKSCPSEDKLLAKKYPRLPGLPSTTDTEVVARFCFNISASPGLARTSNTRNTALLGFVVVSFNLLGIGIVRLDNDIDRARIPCKMRPRR